ncbi:hypothetical protein [Saccharopolyspora sp. ID03-671]|uniref:hypothetical protein n=1 Tax=Saccharopolyspora TaxID=1835 RepID=UPI0038734AA1
MKKLSTPEAETPIFREINKELGELPEIDIHDFDKHAFDFLREYDEQKSQEAVQETPAEEAEPVAVSAGSTTSESGSAGSETSGGRRGGRRRKGN